MLRTITQAGGLWEIVETMQTLKFYLRKLQLSDADINIFDKRNSHDVACILACSKAEFQILEVDLCSYSSFKIWKKYILFVGAAIW